MPSHSEGWGGLFNDEQYRLIRSFAGIIRSLRVFEQTTPPLRGCPSLLRRGLAILPSAPLWRKNSSEKLKVPFQKLSRIWSAMIRSPDAWRSRTSVGFGPTVNVDVQRSFDDWTVERASPTSIEMPLPDPGASSVTALPTSAVIDAGDSMRTDFPPA